MSRYIDANVLKEKILEERDKIPLKKIERYSFGVETPYRDGAAMRGGIRKALRCLEQTPRADVVEVRHGEWMVSAWDGEKVVEIPYKKHEHCEPYCSLCKADALLDGEGFGVASNYCSACGAKMDGERSTKDAT